MKAILIHITLFFMAALVFTGCYTKLNTTSSDDDLKAAYVEDGWYEVDGASLYIDYTTREWFSYYGIGLATDRNFLRSAHFSYHHPTSPYFYSPFRNSYFYNMPGYSNNFFYRTGLWNQRQGFYSFFHPLYYSNPYMHSFYHQRWANWHYHETAFPNYWAGSHAYGTDNYMQPRASYRTAGLSAGSTGVSPGNRSDQARSRITADANEVFTVTSRDRISPPAIERVTLNEREGNTLNRRDTEYSERRDRNRSLHSPRNTWERGNSYGERTRDRAVGSTRSSRTVNRAATNRPSGNSALRGPSNRGSSSGSATRSSGNSRSSGESSSSRGNNE